MYSSNEFEFHQPLSPYICSTPLDFVQERQYLSSIVFPQLNKECNTRGSYFKPIDLSWRPGEPKLQKGLLLKTQLDAVTKCLPFFIGLLGETYGPFREEMKERLTLVEDMSRSNDDQHWLDTNLLLAASGGHPWVLENDYQYCSLTELEVTLGTKGYKDQFVTMYYRTSDHLEDKLFEVKKLEKDKVISLYSSESEQAKMKIHSLRQGLVNKGVPIKYFRTCEELGQMVLEDWLQIMNIMFPPLQHHKGLLESKQYKEWLAQECFLNSHLEKFVSTPEIGETIKQLTNSVLASSDQGSEMLPNYPFDCFLEVKSIPREQKHPSVMVLTGERGVGKSTVLTQWLNRFRTENSCNICIFSHFVSASYHCSSIRYFMKKCIQTLRSAFLYTDGTNEVCDEIESQCMNQNFFYLCEAFSAALALGPCVIVLDGADELRSEHDLSVKQVKECSWIPANLPKSCTFLVSTTPSDISYYSLSQRQDLKVIHCPSSLTDTNFSLQILKQHAPQVKYLLGGDQEVHKLLSLKVMQTALGSKLVASEVGSYRVYSNLSTFLENCAEMSSIRTFWNSCIQSWVQELSWSITKPSQEAKLVNTKFESQGWVIDALSLLAASRNGLTECQVLKILKLIGYKDANEVTAYDWLQFRLLADSTLFESGEGRLVYSHPCLLEIAEFSLFNVIPAVSAYSESMSKADLFGKGHPYHCFLAEYFSQQTLDIQVIEELPWQLMKAGNISELAKLLTDSRFLFAIINHEPDLWEEDLKLYWSVCHKNGIHVGVEYIQLAETLCSRKELQSPYRLPTNTVEELAHCQENRSVPSLEDESSHMIPVATLCWFLARFLQNVGFPDECNKSLAIAIKFLNQSAFLMPDLHIFLCKFFFTFGRHYEMSRDFDNADANYQLSQQALTNADNLDSESLHQKQIHYLKALLLCCHSNIRIVRLDIQTAHDLLLEAQACLNDEFNSRVLKSTIALNLAILKTRNCEYTQAETLLRQSAQLRVQWFGRNHNLVANVFVSLAMLLSCPACEHGSTIQQSKYLLHRALISFEKCYGKTHWIIAGIVQCLGLLDSKSKDCQVQMEAHKYLQRSLDISLMGVEDTDFEFSASKSKEKFTNCAPGEYDISYSLFHDQKVRSRQNTLKLPYVDIFKLGTGFNVQGALRWNSPQVSHRASRENLQSGRKSVKVLKNKTNMEVSDTGERPNLLTASSRLIHRKSKDSPRIISFLKDDSMNGMDSYTNTLSDNHLYYEDFREEDDHLQKDTRKKQLITVNLLQKQLSGSNDEEVEENKSIQGDKKMVRIKSADAPRRLYQKFGSSHQLPFSSASTQNWSGKRGFSTNWSSRTSTSSCSGSHYSHCNVPGRHDITVGNARSVSGPHSDLTSLMGEAPCPRPVSQTLQHRSAWYHVPGRYVTPHESYAKKRMQKTETAKDIESFVSLKSQWIKKQNQKI